MKKVKKERSGGLGGVYVAALFSVTLGVLLAFLALINQPVQELTRKPDEPELGKIYYLKGNVIESPQWPQKLARLTAGAPGSHAFTEGDLNAWAKQNLRPSANAPKREDQPLIRISDFPNLRLTDDDRLQVMLRVEIPMVRPGRPYTYQAFIEMTPDGYRLEEGWIGQAPLPFINKLVFDYLANAVELSEDAETLAQELAETSFAINDELLVIHR